jgi:hypothetical protein
MSILTSSYIKYDIPILSADIVGEGGHEITTKNPKRNPNLSVLLNPALDEGISVGYPDSLLLP